MPDKKVDNDGICPINVISYFYFWTIIRPMSVKIIFRTNLGPMSFKIIFKTNVGPVFIKLIFRTYFTPPMWQISDYERSDQYCHYKPEIYIIISRIPED